MVETDLAIISPFLLNLIASTDCSENVASDETGTAQKDYQEACQHQPPSRGAGLLITLTLIYRLHEIGHIEGHANVFLRVSIAFVEIDALGFIASGAAWQIIFYRVNFYTAFNKAELDFFPRKWPKIKDIFRLGKERVVLPPFWFIKIELYPIALVATL